MKWLATTAVLCLLTTTALAEEKILRIPSAMFCGPYDVDLKGLAEQYGEIPFVEGDGEVLSLDPSKSFHGKIRFFLDPEDYSYSIFLDIDDELTCLIATGESLTPAHQGDGI